MGAGLTRDGPAQSEDQLARLAGLNLCTPATAPLDRLANASYQIVIEGASLPRTRPRTGPCSTERRWVTLKPNGDNSPSTGQQGGSMTLATTGP